MKKILIICLGLVLLMTNFIDAKEYDTRFIDEDNYFSEIAHDEYNEHSKLLLDEFNLEVFFAVTMDEDTDILAFTQEAFDEYRTHEHAVILGVNVSNYEYAFLTSGYMDEALTSDVIDEIVLMCDSAFDIFSALEMYLNSLEINVGIYLTENGFHPEDVPDNRYLDYVYDEADLLDENEELALLSYLEQVSDRQRCDVVVATFNDYEGEDFVAFVDDFYDYNGYGYGRDRDGIILAISMAERDFCMSSLGYGLYAFTDYGLEQMEYAFIDSLSNGDYYEAFMDYAMKADELLTLAHEGTPLDIPQFVVEEIDPREAVAELSLGSLIISVGIGFGIVMHERSRLKTIRFERGAYNYEDRLKRHIYRRYDRLIGSSIQRERIETNSSSSSSSSHSSGGSSSHRSSSGSSHGGRSGKF